MSLCIFLVFTMGLDEMKCWSCLKQSNSRVHFQSGLYPGWVIYEDYAHSGYNSRVKKDKCGKEMFIFLPQLGQEEVKTGKISVLVMNTIFLKILFFRHNFRGKKFNLKFSKIRWVRGIS